MPNQRTQNLKLIAELYEQLDGPPTAILFVNMRDWINIRRDFRRTFINVVRWQRTSTFKVFLEGKCVADLCVDLNNRLPLPKGKLFLDHRINLLAQKMPVVWEQPSYGFDFSWRFRLQPDSDLFNRFSSFITTIP